MTIRSITFSASLTMEFGGIYFDSSSQLLGERERLVQQIISDGNRYSVLNTREDISLHKIFSLGLLALHSTYSDFMNGSQLWDKLIFNTQVLKNTFVAPLSFDFIYEGGSVVLSIKDRDENQINIPLKMIAYNRDTDKDESFGIKESILEYYLHVAQISYMKREATVDQRFLHDKKRRNFHNSLGGLIQLASYKAGVFIPSRLANELCFSLACLYPSKGNPFPDMILDLV